MMADNDTSAPSGAADAPGAPIELAPEAARRELYDLRVRHGDLSAAIEALESGGGDAFTIRRLKKRKLALKDRITALEDALLPDIIA